MKKLITAIGILCVLAGCSHGTHHSVPDDIIYIDKDTVPEWNLPEEDIADGRTRFMGEGLSLIYEDGGILVERSKADYWNIRFVELASGCIVTLTSAGMSNGELHSVMMTINGDAVEVESTKIVNEKGATVWIDILTVARKHYLIVM